MNFFSSIFSDDPEPSESDPPSTASHQDPDETTDLNTSSPQSPNPSTQSTRLESSNSDVWNFGSLIKTLATRSESVIGTYRQEFEDFGSGLLKETVTIRDVASRAVQEFPDSIDAGAAVAQESLESVGQAIDNLGSSVWQGTTKIIARGKDLHIFDEDDEYGSIGGYDDDEIDGRDGYLNERSLNVKKYSWFDTRMREIQSDPKTYTEDPDDAEAYGKWRSGFVLDEKGEEIQTLIGEERSVERIYLELVPVTVDKEIFWCRYFYKVDRIKQTEEARARIVKRAISGEDEEDLSWDVEDEADTSGISDETKDSKLAESSSAIDDIEAGAATADTGLSSAARVDELSNVAGDNCDSCKEDSDVSIISTQPSLPEAQELGWDEIEDMGSDKEDFSVTKTVDPGNISDLRRRLNVVEDDEDLSWDIDDDDEPVKS